MRTILLFIIILNLALHMNAQEQNSEVVASSVGIHVNEQLILEWTLGEIMIESYFHPTIQLTQGFHQPCSFVSGLLPNVETIQPLELTSTSALAGGVVTDEGSCAVIDRGIFWSTNPDPQNMPENRIPLGNGIGTFTCTLEGLSHIHTYYVRAYATNGSGMALGQELSFNLPSPGPDNLVFIYDEVFGSLTDNCVSATDTIIVAGNGLPVVVEPGAMVGLTAGKAILLRYGFAAKEGALFHAWIDTDGSYCSKEKTILTVIEYEEEPDVVSNDFSGFKEDFFRIYPNPTAGILTFELLDTGSLHSIIEIYSIIGEIVYSIEINDIRHSLDLSGRPNGLYIVRVLNNGRPGFEKIIKQ